MIDTQVIRDNLSPVLFKPDTSVFLFVDPLLGDPFPEDDEYHPLVEQNRTRIPVTGRGLEIEERPYMVKLRESDHLFWDHCINLAADELAKGKRAFSAWLCSNHSAEKTAQILYNHMERSLPNGKLGYFRFYDPRVMDCLIPVVQNKSIIHGVDAWYWLKRDGQVMRAPTSDQLLPPPSYSTEQWRAIQNIGTINLTVDVLLQDDIPFKKVNYHVIASAVEEALQYGLTQEADLITFASYAIKIHPQFHTHTSILPVIKRAVQENLSFAGLTSDISEDTWMLITEALGDKR